jgi:purine catabolism regulator
LLAPAIVADHDGELIHTLETYLDNQSSPTETANQLGIHRNTVLNRIEKLRSLLTVNLDDPDERLAVQLACRVVKLKRAGA